MRFAQGPEALPGPAGQEGPHRAPGLHRKPGACGAQRPARRHAPGAPGARGTAGGPRAPGGRGAQGAQGPPRSAGPCRTPGSTQTPRWISGPTADMAPKARRGHWARVKSEKGGANTPTQLKLRAMRTPEVPPHDFDWGRPTPLDSDRFHSTGFFLWGPGSHWVIGFGPRGPDPAGEVCCSRPSEGNRSEPKKFATRMVSKRFVNFRALGQFLT